MNGMKCSYQDDLFISFSLGGWNCYSNENAMVWFELMGIHYDASYNRIICGGLGQTRGSNYSFLKAFTEYYIILQIVSGGVSDVWEYMGGTA